MEDLHRGCKNESNIKHHHRGKSTASIINKSEILSNLNILKGQTILDAGCGNGYMSKEFSKLVADTGKVYALDPDEISINILKNEVINTNIIPLVEDVTTETKLINESIDLIYLSTVIHGFSETQIKGFVHEANKILKYSGILAILEIIKEETPFGPPLKIRISPEELEEKLNLFKTKKIINISNYFYLQLFEKNEN